MIITLFANLLDQGNYTDTMPSFPVYVFKCQSIMSFPPADVVRPNTDRVSKTNYLEILYIIHG